MTQFDKDVTITISGPQASGKSRLAAMLVEKLAPSRLRAWDSHEDESEPFAIDVWHDGTIYLRVEPAKAAAPTATDIESIPPVGRLTSTKGLRVGDLVRVVDDLKRIASFPHKLGDIVPVSEVDGEYVNNGWLCTRFSFIGRPDADGWFEWSQPENPAPGYMVSIKHTDGETYDTCSDNVWWRERPFGIKVKILHRIPEVVAPIKCDTSALQEAINQVSEAIRNLGKAVSTVSIAQR